MVSTLVPSGQLPRIGTRGAMLAICVAATAARLPSLLRPLGSDEGGYLLIGSQWSSGSSLYGDYWVDRPPLLIGIFSVADHLGGAVALRVIGMVAVLAAVLLAALLGRLTAGSRGRRAILLPATITAIFLSSPLLDGSEVDGELLAVPFVLAGVLAAVVGLAPAVLHPHETDPAGPVGTDAVMSRLAAAACGALGIGAFLVKQNVVDVFVVVAVIAIQQAGARRPGTLRWLTTVAAGALATLVVALAWAWSHGTTPAGLWDAVVTFRLQASGVIRAGAPDSTRVRLWGLLTAGLLSGLPLVALGAVRLVVGERPRPPGPPSSPGQRLPDLRWAALAVLGWEAAAVALGGSYWLHYLIGLVPGLVLLIVAGLQRASWTGEHRPGARWTTAATTYAGVCAVAVLAWTTAHPPVDRDATVVAYLRQHSRPGDTVVVGFGDPAIVERSGLASPYPELWSLPVRVRDPELETLTEVLLSASRPRWIVVSGASLGTWGVDASRAQQVLDADYHQVMSAGELNVFVVDSDRAGNRFVS